MSNNKNALKLYVANLPFDMDEEEIQHRFQEFGTISNIFLLKDQQQRSKGVAFVTFEDREDGYNCIDSLNQSFFGKQKIIVKEATNQGIKGKQNERDSTNVNIPQFKLNSRLTKTRELREYEKMLNQFSKSITERSDESTDYSN